MPYPRANDNGFDPSDYAASEPQRPGLLRMFSYGVTGSVVAIWELLVSRDPEEDYSRLMERAVHALMRFRGRPPQVPVEFRPAPARGPEGIPMHEPRAPHPSGFPGVTPFAHNPFAGPPAPDTGTSPSKARRAFEVYASIGPDGLLGDAEAAFHDVLLCDGLAGMVFALRQFQSPASHRRALAYLLEHGQGLSLANTSTFGAVCREEGALSLLCLAAEVWPPAFAAELRPALRLTADDPSLCTSTRYRACAALAKLDAASSAKPEPS